MRQLLLMRSRWVGMRRQKRIGGDTGGTYCGCCERDLDSFNVVFLEVPVLELKSIKAL